jgi:hypothetical protein
MLPPCEFEYLISGASVWPDRLSWWFIVRALTLPPLPLLIHSFSHCCLVVFDFLHNTPTQHTGDVTLRLVVVSVYIWLFSSSSSQWHRLIYPSLWLPFCLIVLVDTDLPSGESVIHSCPAVAVSSAAKNPDCLLLSYYTTLLLCQNQWPFTLPKPMIIVTQ